MYGEILWNISALIDRRRREKTFCCHLHTYLSKANPPGFSLLVWREVIAAGRLKNVGSFCLHAVLTQISRWSQSWAAESGALFFFFPAIDITGGSTVSEVSWATILLTLGSSRVSTMEKKNLKMRIQEEINVGISAWKSSKAHTSFWGTRNRICLGLILGGCGRMVPLQVGERWY